MDRVLRKRRSWIGLVACVAAAHVAAAQSAPTVRPLSYTRFELPNGLIALLNEDHTSPIVSLEILVHVGAKDETTGHTGLAHLCEHLMGEGSPNLTQDEKSLILSLGGMSRTGVPGGALWGATDEDRTHFWYTVPSNQLETALWMEGDRFATPLSHADAEHLKSVREVIRQERLQGRENAPQPRASADRITLDQFYIGRDRHPRDPLGPMTDLDAATAADAKQFCGPYYVPNNIVLALSGDFTVASAERMIRTYFGSIPRGVVPQHPSVAPVAFTQEKRLVVEDSRLRAPILRMAWFGAGVSSPDRERLNALAMALGDDREGRLSKLLVYDRKLATSVQVNNIDMETAGIFQIDIRPSANVSLSTIETVVDSVLKDLSAAPFTDRNLLSFKRSTPVIAATSLQTRTARADTLAQSQTFAGDPDIYVKQAARIARLTPAEVEAAARRYLTAQRVVMCIIPAGKLDLVSKPELGFTNVTSWPKAER